MLRSTRSARLFRSGAAFSAVPVAVWAVLALTSCSTAYVYQSDVTGRHGEHFIEVSCTAASACTNAANKTCKGGFTIVSSRGSTALGDSIVQVIECKPYISNSGIMGPHGETLIEIDCSSSVQTCFDFARKTCNGDYDIFMTSPFLIQCLQQSPPPEFPRAGALPDAG
jgi:hypothetical protein